LSKSNQVTNHEYFDGFVIAGVGLVGLTLYVIYLIGWVGALGNLSRAQQWGWFWGVFFVSGIMLPIYVASGPEPLTPAQVAALKQQRAAPYPPAPPQNPPSTALSPAESSALAILKVRYARGEIDSETYVRMRTQLHE
jgi:hypothetical protein